MCANESRNFSNGLFCPIAEMLTATNRAKSTFLIVAFIIIVLFVETVLFTGVGEYKLMFHGEV